MDFVVHRHSSSVVATTTLAGLLLALLFVFTLFYMKYYWAPSRFGKQEKRRPPIVGTIFHQFLNFRRLHDYHTELSSKHKTFSLFAPLHNQVFTVDPANVEHILRTNFANYGKGRYTYENFKELFGDGIFGVDGDKWRQQRKLASYEFSTKVLRDFSSAVFKRNAAELAGIISEASKSNQIIDIQDLFMRSTMDSMFKVGFGVVLDSLNGSNEESQRFTKAFDDTSVSITKRFVDPFWKIKRFLNIGPEAALKKDIRIVDGFIYKLINAKVEKMSRGANDSEKKEDMLSRFLVEREKDPQSMSHQYLRDIILNFLVAGRDTTAGTLSWFFYMLCKHPSTQEKVAQEIKAAVDQASDDNKNGIITTFDRLAENNITDEVLDKMQYLHAALSETLRLYPAVPLDLKVCFGDDTLPDGFDMGKGDVIFYQPYAMGRMKFLWGDDAEIFRPERWLDDNGIFQTESPFKFTAFQAGPRICLGKEFAYRQMKIFSAVLLYFFRFGMSDEEKAVNYRTMITLQIDEGLYLIPHSRT